MNTLKRTLYGIRIRTIDSQLSALRMQRATTGRSIDLSINTALCLGGSFNTIPGLVEDYTAIRGQISTLEGKRAELAEGLA